MTTNKKINNRQKSLAVRFARILREQHKIQLNIVITKGGLELATGQRINAGTTN